MITYEVKAESMADYLRSLDRRRALVILLVNSFFVFLCFPFDLFRVHTFLMVLLISLMLIVSIATWFDLRKDNDKLRRFSGSRYFADDQSLKLFPYGMDPIEFQWNDIAVVHRKYSGTQVVAADEEIGTMMTGTTYFTRLKIKSFSLGDPGTIFIPRITSNYEDLFETLILKARNASKFY